MPRHHVVEPTSRWWLMIRWEAIMVAVGKVGVFCDVAPVAAINVWYWGCLSVWVTGPVRLPHD